MAELKRQTESQVARVLRRLERQSPGRMTQAARNERAKRIKNLKVTGDALRDKRRLEAQIKSKRSSSAKPKAKI